MEKVNSSKFSQCKNNPAFFAVFFLIKKNNRLFLHKQILINDTHFVLNQNLLKKRSITRFPTMIQLNRNIQVSPIYRRMTSQTENVKNVTSANNTANT